MRSMLYEIGISCVVGRWKECRDLGAQLYKGAVEEK